MVRAGDEEERAYLQERLVTYSQILFWAMAALVAFLAAVYSLYPDIEPEHTPEILAGWVVLIVGVGITWRFVLDRRVLSVRQLRVIDIGYAAAAGIAFGCSAYFSPDLRASAYTSMILCTFMLFTRAVVLPARAKHTALVSAIGLAPLIAAAIGLALTARLDVPGPAFVLGACVLIGLAAVLATLGSHIIYGLRKEESASIRLGHYTLEHKLGEGGMGVVYRARHVLLRRPTAIKLLLPHLVDAELLARFEAEVHFSSQLTHPNTVSVFDYGHSADGTFYYAMEYLDGIDLEKLVARYGAQPAPRVVHILVQVCGALQEAHDLRIIHRDIKPANIMLCERGGRPDIAKVVDFGLVKEITGDAATKTQKVLGTPAYLAPEAITAPGSVGPAADLYALGAVGYYLLAGRRVFEGATALDVCVRHVTATPAPLDGTPPALAAVIMRALAKQPSERYASAAELAAALHAADAGAWTDREARDWWSEIAKLDDPQGTVLQATETLTLQLEPRT